MNYKTHPLAELFPIMAGSEMTKLVADIKANGLKFPIVLFDGMILDGRHRYEACELAEVKPKFTEYEGEDALGFVLSSNLHRRHLNESQRAMVAAKIADLKRGEQPKSKSANLRFTHEAAAKTLNVSERSVDTASKIIDESPRLAKQVSAGKISLNAASKEIKEEKKSEKEQLDKTGWPIPKGILPAWDDATNIAREFLNLTSKMKGVFTTAQDKKSTAFNEVVYSAAIANCQSLYGDWKRVLPYAVCPTCQGKTFTSCAMCKKRGFISEFYWNQCVPAELKKLREKILKGK